MTEHPGPGHAELPPEKRDVLRAAVRLEWITIAYLISAVTFVGLVLGSSQAMKAAWVEDTLSLLPPIAFLIAMRIRHRRPDERHPWGYHRIVSIAFLAAALALLTFGLLIFLDSVMKLVTAERPPVGTVVLFGEQFWAGWLMLAALAWSAGPPIILGRRKQRLAAELHDKVLHADAGMNRADWMTATAAAVGVVGIGFGLWFADAVAGALISLDITRDGWRNVKAAGNELMDARPTTYDLERPHPLVEVVDRELRQLDWVEDVHVRLREEGHVLAGEAHVVARSGGDLVRRLEEAAKRLYALDWRLHDILLVPVTPEALAELRPRD